MYCGFAEVQDLRPHLKTGLSFAHHLHHNPTKSPLSERRKAFETFRKIHGSAGAPRCTKQRCLYKTSAWDFGRRLWTWTLRPYRPLAFAHNVARSAQMESRESQPSWHVEPASWLTSVFRDLQGHDHSKFPIAEL